MKPLMLPSGLTPKGLSLQDSYYIMPVGVEGVVAAEHKMVPERKLLKCPMDLLGKGWKLSGSGRGESALGPL